jgi:very-short-patch-repair endonuclease
LRISDKHGIDNISPDARIARWADAQYGVVSVAQAREAGLQRSSVRLRVDDGRWQRLLPGVYRLVGAPTGWKQSLSAGLLWAGDDAVASHRCAGRLWELDGVRCDEIELVVPAAFTTRVEGVRCFRTTTLSPRDVTRRQGLRVTTLPRTLIDLAAVLDEEHLEMALESALRRNLSLGWLQKRLWQIDGRGVAGAGVLKRLVGKRKPKAETADSALEVRVARLLRESRLPKPVLHFDICEGRHHVAEVDFAWPASRVALQADGFEKHSGFTPWRRDKNQSSWLASLGWLVLNVTWHDLDDDPEEVIRRLRNALDERAHAQVS